MLAFPLQITLPQTADLVPGIQLALLLVLGLLLATATVVRLQPQRTSGSLRDQVVSWWFLLPAVFAVWVLYPLGVLALVLLISALAATELSALSECKARGGLRLWFNGLITVQAALSVMGMSAWNIPLMAALAAMSVGTWYGFKCVHRGLLLQAVFAIQAAGLWCLVAMPPASMPQRLSATWFLYLCVVTALNDIAQFLIGTRFGRHRLAMRISPNKTWQGAGGGLLFSVLCSLAVGHVLELASPFWLLCMGPVLSIAGILGDLMFSLGKRLLNVKDYGRLIPGHGGVLDRVDSLVLTAPTLMIALQLR